MKANELRLGNLVYARKGDVTDVCLTEECNDLIPYRMVYISVGFGLGKVIEPIPLSPEILEKAGFMKYQWMNGYFIKTKFGEMMIQFFEKEIHLYFTNITYDSMGMKMNSRRYIGNINTTQNIAFIHQLQNLYFALCGEELNITL